MTCPGCGGEGSFLGGLGRLEWFRCRACGLDFSRDSRRVTGCACAGCERDGLCLADLTREPGLTAADRRGTFWARGRA